MKSSARHAIRLLIQLVPFIGRRARNHLGPFVDGIALASIDGVLLQVDTKDYWAGGQIFYERTYEPFMTGLIMSNISDGKVFWDVGANLGFFSVTVAHNYPSCHVVAFEPNPTIVNRLNKNKELNNLQNLHLVALALSNSAGEIDFFLNKSGTNEMMGALAQYGKDSRVVSVRASPGDDLGVSFPSLRVGGLLSPDLIKIDVEGAEGLVLSGLARTLRTYRPVLLIELHPDLLKRLGSGVRRVVELLDEAGYDRHYFSADGTSIDEKRLLEMESGRPILHCTPAS